MSPQFTILFLSAVQNLLFSTFYIVYHTPEMTKELHRAVSQVEENLLFSICENKGADQLLGNRAADHRLCFRYIDSTNP